MINKNILFVCSLAEVRSPCAASFVDGSKYAGTSTASDVVLSKASIDWADSILCMEKIHKEELLERFPFAVTKEIFVLDIPADYSECDEDLKEILKRRLSKFDII